MKKYHARLNNSVTEYTYESDYPIEDARNYEDAYRVGIRKYGRWVLHEHAYENAIVDRYLTEN